MIINRSRLSSPRVTPQLETARAYAAVVVLSVFAVTLFALLAIVERRALPWAHRTRRAS